MKVTKIQLEVIRKSLALGYYRFREKGCQTGSEDEKSTFIWNLHYLDEIDKSSTKVILRKNDPN